ncbi:hypothetical protein ACQPTN_06010 [Bradyrhizobium sp. 13971]
MPIGWLHANQNILDIDVIGHVIGVRIFGRRYAFADNLRPIGLERQEVAADFAELEPSGAPSDPCFVLARGRRPLIRQFAPARVQVLPQEGRTDEAIEIHGRAHYRDIEGA